MVDIKFIDGKASPSWRGDRSHNSATAHERSHVGIHNTLTIDTGSEHLEQCLAMASEVTCYLND